MTAGDDTVIEGFYDLGAGLVVSADCLEMSYETVLGARRMVITLPSFEPNRIALIEPPLVYRRPDSWVNVDPPDPWGHTRISEMAEDGVEVPRTVCVKRFRIKISVDSAEASESSLGPRLDEELENWWVHFSAWAEVLSGQILAELGMRRPPGPPTFHLWTGADDGTMRPLSMLINATVFPEVNVLTSYGLQECLRFAARQQMPAPEWLLLRDARALHQSGEWRRAVIDAATAAELAINAWIDRRLASTEAAVRSALLSDSRTLGPLSKQFRRLGGNLPNNFAQQVITPRNKAMHRGHPLTESESGQALSCARTLLETASPLAV